jgi:Endonuclease-reverse transcriptase
MDSVALLWVNACCSNTRLHAILNSNKHTDLILVQEPWFDRIDTVRSDFEPGGTDTLGMVANPLWDILYPKYNLGKRCKVVAYRCISSTSFTVTNRLDLGFNYHTLTIDVHTDAETFRIYNIYHDAHTADAGNETDRASRETRIRSLNHITSLEIDPLVPTVIGGDFNTHARAWSPLDVCQSTWAIDIEEWAITQGLDLLNTPGIPTHRGDRRQRDTTIDLIWINEAAIHDNTFQDLKIDFAASLGSDHAGLWLTHHLLQAIDHTPPHNWLPPYTIQNMAKEAWTNKFRADARILALVLDPAEIEAESTRLSSCIKETSIAIFDQRKEYSPRGARWWNNNCQQAVREVRNATTTKTRKAAQKTLCSTICTAKKDWANNLLHNATTESLWKAACWRHGRRQRNIPALSTEEGLSSDKVNMTATLRSRFFKENPPPVEWAFPDDPEPLPQRHFHLITDAEIAEALKDISNTSAPGKSGHGWKLVKWAWEACPEWFVTLFNVCLYAGTHPKTWKTAMIAVVLKPGKTDYSALCPFGLLWPFGQNQKFQPTGKHLASDFWVV